MSLPVKLSVAPLATVTVAVSAKRLAAPKLSVPLLTVTVLAPALPLSVLAPVDVKVPAPRLRSARPPASA